MAVPGLVKQGLKEEPWVLGLAVMKIDPHHFMVMRLEAAGRGYEVARKMFDGVVEERR